MGSVYFYIIFLIFLLSDQAVGLNIERDEDHEHGEHGDIGDRFDETRVRSHTQSEKDTILAKHRFFRSKANPEASDMEYITWNDNLAHLADLWASVCYAGHGLPDHDDVALFPSIGQNIQILGTKPTGEASVKEWKKERKNYDYATNTCATGKICSHYTQLYWANSKEVGCGRAFCATTIDKDGNRASRNNVWIEACFYAPAGNFGGKPYQLGAPCTKCQSGIGQCFEKSCGLCSDHPGDECDCKQVCENCGTVTSDCKCSCKQGYLGDYCEKECKDTSNKCYGAWTPRNCGSKFVQKGCPLMCGICEAPDPTDQCVA